MCFNIKKFIIFSDLFHTGVSSKCPSTTYQGSPHPDVNETNMQMESVGCLVSNISWDGEVPDKMESPCKETPQVSATYLDVVRNPLETRLSMFGVRLLREGP